MCASRVMFASQVTCASRVKSGAHHITLRQSRKTSLRRKPQHHLRRQRKHHCNRHVSLCHWGRFPLTHLSLPDVSIRTVPVDTSLVFDDGSVVSFEDMTRSYFDCYSLCNDEDGNEWKCQLTELHAFCRQIQETSSIKTTSIIELCAITGAILYNWIGGIVLLTKPKK